MSRSTPTSDDRFAGFPPQRPAADCAPEYRIGGWPSRKRRRSRRRRQPLGGERWARHAVPRWHTPAGRQSTLIGALRRCDAADCPRLASELSASGPEMPPAALDLAFLSWWPIEECAAVEV